MKYDIIKLEAFGSGLMKCIWEIPDQNDNSYSTTSILKSYTKSD
jgi:hypothetical protein